MADRVHRYVMGLDCHLVDSCMAMDFHPGIDIAQVQAYAQGVEDRHRGHQPERDFNRGQHKRTKSVGYYGDCRGGQPQQYGRYPSQGSRQSRPPLPHCPHCDKAHSGKCHFGTNACFTCSRQGHVMRDCLYRGSLESTVQPIGLVAGLSSSVAMRPTGQSIQTPAGHAQLLTMAGDGLPWSVLIPVPAIF
ncbi:uncharacterized protein LOC129899906 [Solanum dulcamara]|uniref:uncharacterized protein LOC129899906 n=1 Tax=Solanum dulcamara TaxID=45834 RepID=UPI0024868B83|nr:uncharacterized protein LOC129899906 [Solanum dulcamara]